MNTQQLVRLWNEYCDETLEPIGYPGFMNWLQDKDTTPNPYRYQESHVEGRRYICLTGTEWYERFLKELPADSNINLESYRGIKNAARRASGIEADHE